MISLSGLVVRNGIILVEYADKLLEDDDSRSIKSRRPWMLGKGA